MLTKLWLISYKESNFVVKVGNLTKKKWIFFFFFLSEIYFILDKVMHG